MRRRENGARIVDEFLHPQETFWSSDPSSLFDLSPEELAKVKALFGAITWEANERLAREMTLVFKLNRERSIFRKVGYMTKGDAAKATSVMPGELLDLYPLYGGLHIFNDHLFIADELLFSAFQRYGLDITLADLVQRLMSEYEFPPRHCKVAA